MGVRDALRAARGLVRKAPSAAGTQPIGRSGWDVPRGQQPALHVEWFYPARPGTSGPPVPMFSESLRQAMHRHMQIPLAMLPKKQLAAGHRDVPLGSEVRGTVLFLHGFSSFALQNRRHLEMLASHGWVAGAISLPGDSLVTESCRGEITELDVEAPAVKALRTMRQNAAAIADEIAPGLEAMRMAPNAETYLAALDGLAAQDFFSLYVPVAQRMGAALAEVIAAIPTADHPVARAVDLERLALMGHSLGGAASIAIAQQRARAGHPVRSVIDLDGAAFLHDGGLDLGCPAAFFHAHASRVGERPLSNANVNTGWLKHGSNVGISVECAQATHPGFTDLAFNPAAQAMGALGSLDGARFGTWMHQATLAFLDTHMTGAPTPLPERSAVRVESYR